jgi:hypothetical protein
MPGFALLYPLAVLSQSQITFPIWKVTAAAANVWHVQLERRVLHPFFPLGNLVLLRQYPRLRTTTTMNKKTSSFSEYSLPSFTMLDTYL